MAEQVSHNVVNNNESASAAQALADVIANPTNTASAAGEHGTNAATDIGSLDRTAKATISTTPAEIETPGAAEPSAGDATAEVAEINRDEISGGLREEEKAETGGLVNGVHDANNHGEVPEEGSAADNSVDPSVTSDTEGSQRADGTDTKKEMHHARTGSVKKPTTFSKVSVTKNFMAKSSTPTPPAGAVAAKPGEKPTVSAAAQPVSLKPRLVAKTGLQNMQKARPGGDGSSVAGPDASRVWNRNRPAPVAPPKQFTDEELKQQYGIHMATRLQTEEGGKDSKWADIDDDEDDWVPETVVWMDGTKSTLTAPEPVPVPQKEQAALPQPSKPAEGAKPTLAVKRPTESGPPKTILKPGIAMQQAKLQNGALAASSSDKPSLTAKSPAATQAKSPWAPLPPVETISPINPPVQQPPPVPSALPTQDARAYEPQPPSQPAREIAADTFERSWREGEGAPRELFNSANGRYEPAPEGRRSSIRSDNNNFRKPAVLQRPSQHSPAEPSAAFQTRSSNQVDGASWGRRRGSSVSQGSNPPGRRMSMAQPSDLPPAIEDERRSSTVIGHDMRTSPKLARNEPARPSFSQQSAWDQQMPPRPPPGAEQEDPIKAQERIMREKREEAKRRRKEEEERAEKERQERLKAKLAALEGAGKSRKEREAEAAATAASVQTPASEKSTELTAPTAKVDDRPAIPLLPAEASATVAPALESQTLAPAPEAEGADPSLPSPLSPMPQSQNGLPERPTTSADQTQRQAPRQHLSPRTGTRAPFGQQSAQYRAQQQPFGRSPLTDANAFSGWNTTAPNGNVWGTSGIGNGTFEKASTFAPVPMSQQTSSLPPPPGMGRPTGSARISPQGFGREASSPIMQPQPVTEPQRTLPPPGIDSRPETTWGTPRTNGVSPAPGLTRQAHGPGPIAPPSRAQQQQQLSAQRADPLSAWNHAARDKLPQEYLADAQAAERRAQEGAATPAPSQGVVRETFKQASTDQSRPLGAPRRFDKTEYTIHDHQGSRSVSTLSPAPPSTQTQPVGPVPTASPLYESHKQPGENTVRIPDGSLNPAHGGMPMQQQQPIGPPGRQQAPAVPQQGGVNFPADPLAQMPFAPSEHSPPPPEPSSLMVNSGDSGRAGRPTVKLPPPPPVVRLPPAPTSALAQQQQYPASIPHRPLQVWGPPGAARPIVQNEDWQARFNGLFNRMPIQTEAPPSPPKTPPKVQGPSLAVAVSSKAFMDEAYTSATVSLPLPAVRKNVTAEGFTIDDSTDVTSKPTIDSIFRDELSFGSQPQVRILRNAVYEPEVYTNAPHSMLKMGPNSKLHRAIDAQTIPDLSKFWWPKQNNGVFVKLLGVSKLIRYSAASRKPSGIQHERKASGKFNKGKDGNNVNSGSNSPVAHGTPNAGSRKTSFQKGPTPTAPASPAAGASPVNVASAPNGEGGRRKSQFAKGPRKATGPLPSRAQ